jgi:peptidyl-prolyl cis-trans isomerase C
MKQRTWALVGIVAFATLTTPLLAQSPKPAAVVNGVAIPMSEVEALLKARPQAVSVPEAKLKEMRSEALDGLINDLLLQQFLQKNGPKVDPTAVNKVVGDLTEGLKKQGKSLADFCKETNQTEAQLRTRAACELQLDGYIKAKVTDAEVKRYYDEYRDFFDQVVVRVSHIVLRVTPTASPAERQQLKDKLLAIRKQIVDGQITFADAAKKYSQSETASKGGEIGLIPRKTVPIEEAFLKAAFALPVGQVSDVVQTEFGLHLLLVSERTPPKPSDFEKLKESVRDFCVDDLIQDTLAQERKVAKIEINLP